MARRLGWAALRAVGCCVVLYLVALVVAQAPMPESARERLMELTLAPLFLVSKCITSLIDAFGPQGLSERASSYVSVSTVRVIMVLTVSLTFLGLVGLALLSDKVGWRIPVGLALGVAGVMSATEGFSAPVYPESAGSPETWLGSTVALAGMYLIVVGAARRLAPRRSLRLAGAVALACTAVAASWLMYLVAR